jgi:hypothetical protein
MAREKWKDPLTKAERKEYEALLDKAQKDPRICLSVAYFDSKADAERFGELSRKAGNEYNGGWFHGMACGREPGRDFVAQASGTPRYAATY